MQFTLVPVQCFHHIFPQHQFHPASQCCVLFSDVDSVDGSYGFGRSTFFYRHGTSVGDHTLTPICRLEGKAWYEI